MTKELIRKFLILAVMIGLMVLLTGCDKRDCVKSHKKSTVCTYSIYNGKTVTPIIVPCTVTVCDEYAEVKE